MYHKVAFFASFLRCFAAYRLTRWRLARYNAHFFAQMAELVDALVSGSSVRKDVEVRVFFWAPNFEGLLLRAVLFFCEQSLLSVFNFNGILHGFSFAKARKRAFRLP